MEPKKLPDDFWTANVDVDPLAQNPDVGAELTKIEEHETELGGIVEKMWKDMQNECKLLEGTELPPREEIQVRIVEVDEKAEMERLYMEEIAKMFGLRAKLENEELSIKEENKK